MLRLIQHFLHAREGVTAIEYAFIAAMIALVVATTVASIGTSLNGFFTKLEGCLSALTATACT